MAHETGWHDVGSRLQRQSSLTVVQFEVGGPVTDDDLEVLRLLNKTPPPPAILKFLKSSNGVKLLWTGTLNEQEIQGSVNILPLIESSLRAPAEEGGQPLEDVLWNDEFAPGVLKDLKRMSIFESIAGQSSYLTYFFDEPDARLYLVDNDRIRPIVPDFETTVELMKLYAGAHPLREFITHKDWRDRLQKDRTLQSIAAI